MERQKGLLSFLLLRKEGRAIQMKKIKDRLTKMMN